MGRVEQYHTHTRIFVGYIILPIPIPMGVNLYPYPAGTHTHQILYKLLTILLLSIVYWRLERGISIFLLWGDMWITTNA
jgi:hypothetical protein